MAIAAPTRRPIVDGLDTGPPGRIDPPGRSCVGPTRRRDPVRVTPAQRPGHRRRRGAHGRDLRGPLPCGSRCPDLVPRHQLLAVVRERDRSLHASGSGRLGHLPGCQRHWRGLCGHALRDQRTGCHGHGHDQRRRQDRAATGRSSEYLYRPVRVRRSEGADDRHKSDTGDPNICGGASPGDSVTGRAVDQQPDGWGPIGHRPAGDTHPYRIHHESGDARGPGYRHRSPVGRPPPVGSAGLPALRA